ncbi:MAG TPA: polysaccharide deacetylase family protein [Opitutus sp.]|nr:polysaccharide deacetylase family protein [Opitutus sp.]
MPRLTLSLTLCAVALLSAVLPAATTSASSSRPAPMRVALMIDDGPDAAQAGEMHALFARENIRVTFAHVGQNIRKHPHLSRAAAAAGHELVNHSYTHPHFLQLDDAAIHREVAETSAAIKEASGQAPRWFWAPYGDWDQRIEAAVRGAGLEHVPWGGFRFISTEDWNRETDAATIRRRATSGVQDKTLILFHEWREETLAELPAIIAELKRQGCVFITVSELVAAARP